MSLGFFTCEHSRFGKAGTYKSRASWGRYFGTCQPLSCESSTLGLSQILSHRRYQNSLADVSCEEAWFRWAGDIAALFAVRVEAPRDMGFLHGRTMKKIGDLLGERSDQVRKWRNWW